MATAPAAKNGMATAGMICGIVGIVLCWFPFIGLIAGLLGIVFGAIGMSKAGRLNGLGKGAGITGLVCGILSFFLTGMMAAIAIPAFLEYMDKGKRTDTDRELRRIETHIKVYYNERAELPPSAAEMPGPAETVCDNPGRKHPVRPIADYLQDPGWQALDFWIDTRIPYSFKWTRESATRGSIEARMDLDCDAEISVERWDITLVQGNLEVTRLPRSRD